jgi:hypothetical protein
MIEGKTLDELCQLIDAANAEIARWEADLKPAVEAFLYVSDYLTDEDGVRAGLIAAYPHLKRAMGDA